MKRLALTLLLVAALCAAAGAQTRDAQTQSAPTQGIINEEKRRDIIRLLEVTKAADLGTQIIQQMTGSLRESFAMMPAETRDKIFKTFEEEMSKEFGKEKMIEMVVPIYDKYLSAEDVKGLIAFYESPLGQRTIEALPAISREAYEDGARRGREAGLRVMSRLASEGLLNPPSVLPTPTKPKSKPHARRMRG
jgi:hypothetical protein